MKRQVPGSGGQKCDAELDPGVKFDEVLSRLMAFEPRPLFMLSQHSMENIYSCVLENRLESCIELGTGLGTTTCIIAAALDEIGAGRVTTVDMLLRPEVNVKLLARYTGLEPYIESVVDPLGYDWYLADLSSKYPSSPSFDFCFLDGAHEWIPDALAVFLVMRLLRSGAWLVLDDMDFRLRGCQPDWARIFADRTLRELDAYHVRMVYDLVVRQDPAFGDFAETDCGRIGWARKRALPAPGNGASAWSPRSGLLSTEREELDRSSEWSQTFAASTFLPQSHTFELTVSGSSDESVSVTSHGFDPYLILPALARGDERSIDYLTIRLQVLASNDAPTLKIYWSEAEDQGFHEVRSERMVLPDSNGLQEYTFVLNFEPDVRKISRIRIDPIDCPGDVLLRDITVGALRRELRLALR